MGFWVRMDCHKRVYWCGSQTISLLPASIFRIRRICTIEIVVGVCKKHFRQYGFGFLNGLRAVMAVGMGNSSEMVFNTSVRM